MCSYNESIAQKLRDDWVDYMWFLGEAETFSFLSHESEEASKREEYRQKAYISSERVRTIEDAFASMMGKQFMTKLAEIRDMDFNEFDDKGSIIKM